MLDEIHLHNIRDRMLALRSLPNFGGLSDDSLLLVAEHARERRFPPGTVVYAEDRPVDRIYIAITGRIALTRRGRPNRMIQAPGGFGILGTIARDREGWGAITETESVTLEIASDAFLAALEEDFALMRNSLRIMSSMAVESRGNLPLKPDRAPPIVLGEYPDREPTLCERVIALGANASPFANANMDAIIEVCRCMTPMHVEPGHVFFNVGEPSTYSLRVFYGSIRCTAASGEHVDIGPDMVLGALDAFAGRPRSYSARAESRVLCYRTPVEDFLTVIEMHPPIGMSLMRTIAATLIAVG